MRSPVARFSFADFAEEVATSILLILAGVVLALLVPTDGVSFLALGLVLALLALALGVWWALRFAAWAWRVAAAVWESWRAFHPRGRA